MSAEFEAFPKIPRLNSTDWVLTEKLDGTNAQIHIREVWRDNAAVDGETVVDLDDSTMWAVRAGSRTRWISPDSDNFGFAKWVKDNAKALCGLGLGRHFGEWYGAGINRGYGLKDKHFALFNTHRWGYPNDRPHCCQVVTTLATVPGRELNEYVNGWLDILREGGSQQVAGFPKPEGVVIYHRASGQLYKALCENDDIPKSLTKADVALAA